MKKYRFLRCAVILPALLLFSCAVHGFSGCLGIRGDGDPRDDAGLSVNGEPLLDGSTYKVAINDFLISGKEQGLSYFSDRNPGVRATCMENSHIRFVFRDHLRKPYGGRQ